MTVAAFVAPGLFGVVLLRKPHGGLEKHRVKRRKPMPIGLPDDSPDTDRVSHKFCAILAHHIESRVPG